MSQPLEQDITCPDCGYEFTLDYSAEDTEGDCPECGCVIVLTIDPATGKVTEVASAEEDEDDEDDEDEDDTEIEVEDDEEDDDEGEEE